MTKKNIIRSITIAVLAAVSLSSCDLETSDNGDLDGFWHLNRIDTIATGGVCDMSEKLIFWSVQVDLLLAMDRETQANGVFFRFNHSDDSLRLYDPHLDSRTEGDPVIDSAEELRQYGINALDEHFGVEHLSSSRMTLCTDELKLYFNKM